MSRQDPHEYLTRRGGIKSGSNKSFGLVFTVVFALIGLWPILNDKPVRFWALGTGVVLLLISFAVPQFLAPFNRLWFLIGLTLHKIVSPVVMGFLFYATVTPIGLIMRTLGKRPLRLKFDPEAETLLDRTRTPRA